MSSEGKYWDRAWSLVEGCTPVSVACDNCWLAGMDDRFNGGFTEGGRFKGEINMRADRLGLPMKTNKPTVWAVWSDLFHESVPFVFTLSALIHAVGSYDRHKYLILTKRPQTALEFFEWMKDAPVTAEIRDCFWFGTTVENQQAADDRIPQLLQVLGKKFLSIEPMLGPVDLARITEDAGDEYGDGAIFFDALTGERWMRDGFEKEQPFVPRLDWVILGCESGPKRRPMDIKWARDVIRQCKAAGVPVFVKQLDINGKVSKKMEEWPEDLRVRELPWKGEVK